MSSVLYDNVIPLEVIDEMYRRITDDIDTTTDGRRLRTLRSVRVHIWNVKNQVAFINNQKDNVNSIYGLLYSPYMTVAVAAQTALFKKVQYV